jgi:flagellar biosynthesis component FlhA
MSTLTANPLFLKVHANRGMILPMAFIGLLVVILVPLPAFVLDFLLVVNITISVIVLVTTMYVQSPLEFAVFPSLLLAVTLFRLVLNVATTRLILTASGTPEVAEHMAGEVVPTSTPAPSPSRRRASAARRSAARPTSTAPWTVPASSSAATPSPPSSSRS